MISSFLLIKKIKKDILKMVNNMNNLVINGKQINSYMLSMVKLLNEYLEEIDNMMSYKEELVWESDNKEIFVNTVDNNLKKHYLKIKKLYEMVIFLDGYLNEYSDCIKEVKNKFDKLDNMFNIGDNYERD